MDKNELIRGDTFKFDFTIPLEDGNLHLFQEGDVLKAGFKSSLFCKEYIAFQKIEIEEETDTVKFNFSHEIMKDISVGECILEIELTNALGEVYTVYQEQKIIKGDVINE